MAIFDVLRSTANVLQEAGKIEQYKQILDVQEKLLEMQKKIIDLEEENKILHEKINIKQNLIPEGNEYWILKDGKKDGPFCTNCWDSNNKLIRLHSSPTFRSVSCPNCKTVTKPGQAFISKPSFR